jgi:hypothetical protein
MNTEIRRQAIWTVKKSALKSVATSPLSECTSLDKDHLPELFDYTPLLNLCQEALDFLILDLYKFKIF